MITRVKTKEWSGHIIQILSTGIVDFLNYYTDIFHTKTITLTSGLS